MQNLIEKILRMKIYNSVYWKEHCFGLTAESLVDKAVEINHLGGTFGGQRKPTSFMCLVLKLLQLQPDREIIVEFIKNEDYKYVRVLGEGLALFCRDQWLSCCSPGTKGALSNLMLPCQHLACSLNSPSIQLLSLHVSTNALLICQLQFGKMSLASSRAHLRLH